MVFLVLFLLPSALLILAVMTRVHITAHATKPAAAVAKDTGGTISMSVLDTNVAAGAKASETEA